MTNKEMIEKGLLVATQTKDFVMGHGVHTEIPVLFKKHFPGKKAMIIADCNTWKAAGEDVFSKMKEAGIDVDKFIIEEKEFHAEWKYVMMVEEVLKEHQAIAVSVGSGVINDLCKLASHHLDDQRYISVATAASVDGYTSFGASITFEGAKQTFDCPAPIAMVADVDVLAHAPKEMTAAGYADLAAKVPAGGSG